jgi:CheY-like chemotaxis protein
MVQEEAREKKIELLITLEASQAVLNGDPTRLQQLFWNIARNAVKFTGVGGRIRVASINVPAPDGTGQRARIQVSDDGIGFAPSLGKQIFEPFERGVSDDQRFPGLGLGLAIARAIVDLHGGEIRAESMGENRGATFTVDLPVTGATLPKATQAPELPLPRETEVPLRLMVVEDHPPTLHVITRMLERAGHKVQTASTLAQARELAARETFDAVLSDVGLPDGTGVELMTELSAKHRLRGIALSGYGMEEDVKRSLAAGFVAHLVKPVEIHELRRALARLQE